MPGVHGKENNHIIISMQTKLRMTGITTTTIATSINKAVITGSGSGTEHDHTRIRLALNQRMGPTHKTYDYNYV